MRYETFANGEYYHVYNRGVDHRTTFRSESDLERFQQSLRVFNSSENLGENISFRRRCQQTYPIDQQLIRIHGFSLLTNHFHLLEQQIQPDGIPQFMHRLGTGYTKYLNRDEKRTGYLFESPFKAKHVYSDIYLLRLIRYIHLNPLGLIGMDWKKEGVTDRKAALNFLKDYRWSSFYYYFNGIESPVLDFTLLNSLFPSPKDHLDFMFDYQPSQELDEVSFF